MLWKIYNKTLSKRRLENKNSPYDLSMSLNLMSIEQLEHDRIYACGSNPPCPSVYGSFYRNVNPLAAVQQHRPEAERAKLLLEK